MTVYTIHQSLPEGFEFANASQQAHYDEYRWIPGARKIAWVIGDNLERLIAVRLGPPREVKHIKSTAARIQIDNLNEGLSWYIAEYNNGWAVGKRNGEIDRAFTSAAWDDGYLDAIAGRVKWHITHCLDHDPCGEGRVAP